ncbi:MAG: hypothetical protein H7Z43_08705, partial [Clostridia bacterium]|nr:hypothetical protein [Deltaproteobacteria bacterium]
MNSSSESAKSLLDLTALELERLVLARAEVRGHGMEANGAGNPEVNRRREAVASMLAARRPEYSPHVLREWGPNVADDVAWVIAAERTDPIVQRLGSQFECGRQFEWSRNGNPVSNSEGMQTELTARMKLALKTLGQLDSGIQKFFNPSADGRIGSMLALAFIIDPDKQSASFADAILQFRARNQTFGARAAKVAPPAIAEQRIVLARLANHDHSRNAQRAYALARLAVLANPLTAMNDVFHARNAVAKLRDNALRPIYGDEAEWVSRFVPGDASHSVYNSIHHNYSSDTPRNVRLFIEEFIFPIGKRELRAQTFDTLIMSLEAARTGQRDQACTFLESLHKKNESKLLDDIVVAARSSSADSIAEEIVRLVGSVSRYFLGRDQSVIEDSLNQAATVYRLICKACPSFDRLRSQIFHAGSALPEMAGAIVEMQSGDALAGVRAIGRARLELRRAFREAHAGFERLNILRFDGLLDRLSLEILGCTVERIGFVQTAKERSEALLGVQCALRCVRASELDAIYHQDDVRAEPDAIRDVLAKVDDLVPEPGKQKRVSLETYRSVMADVDSAVRTVIRSTRHFFESREKVLAQCKITIDSEFMDQLIKLSPLHYAAAIAQKAMRSGSREVVTERYIADVTGMRVLNSIGPVVFSSVVTALTLRDLTALQPAKDAMTVVYSLEEKKMVTVGGLVTDVKDAPGGMSHLTMYAINHGITVIALPELATRYSKFFVRAQHEGGIYIDDRNNRFEMMTVAYAKEQNRLIDAEIAYAKAGKPGRIWAKMNAL